MLASTNFNYHFHSLFPFLPIENLTIATKSTDDPGFKNWDPLFHLVSKSESEVSQESCPGLDFKNRWTCNWIHRKLEVVEEQKFEVLAFQEPKSRDFRSRTRIFISII